MINGRPSEVRRRLERAVNERAPATVSTISLFDLWYGVAKSQRVEFNSERLVAFLGLIETVPFDEEDARIAGSVRAALERAGSPIGAYDCLIAAQAIRGDMTLVTSNVREFERVPGLRIEDWSV